MTPQERMEAYRLRKKEAAALLPPQPRKKPAEFQRKTKAEFVQWTEEMLGKVIALRESGASYAAIGAQLGVSRQRVQQVLKAREAETDAAG